MSEPYDNVTTVGEPGVFELTLKSSCIAGVTITDLLLRFGDLLRGHSYNFDGSIELVEPQQEIMEVETKFNKKRKRK